MQVVCRTNLDDMEREVWPNELPFVQIGQKIESGTRWPKMPRCGIELEVKSVTWKFGHIAFRFPAHHQEWYAEVELHLARLPFLSVSHWENWYNKIRGAIEEETYIRREQEIREEAYQAGLRRLGRGPDAIPRAYERLEFACRQFYAKDVADPVKQNAELDIQSALRLLADLRRADDEK